MLDFVMMNNSVYMAIATLSVMLEVFVQLNWNALMVINMYNMAVFLFICWNYMIINNIHRAATFTLIHRAAIFIN